MFHYLHQLEATFVCLLLVAGQGAYSGSVRVACWKPVCGPENQNNELKEAKKLHRAEGNRRISDNSLWVCHYERHLSHYIQSSETL